MPLHTILVIVHAATATIALAAGLLAPRHPVLVTLHAGTVLGMTASLGAAVVVGRSEAAPGATAVFAGLVVIALVMSGQALLAWSRRPRGADLLASVPCLRPVGFNCVGLVTGFVAVALTRLTSNGLLVTAASVGTVVLGRAVLRRSTVRGAQDLTGSVSAPGPR